MLMSSGLACTSASFCIGVLWCRGGGGRTDSCAMRRGDVVPPPPYRFTLVKKELFVNLLFSRWMIIINLI